LVQGSSLTATYKEALKELQVTLDMCEFLEAMRSHVVAVTMDVWKLLLEPLL
jgi:hypothetical protein